MKYRYVTVLFLCSVGIMQAFAQQATGTNNAPSTAGSLPLTNRKNLSPLEQILIANTKAVPVAWKKKDADFFKRTLTDDFLEVAIDGKVYGKNDVLEGVHMADVQEYSPYDAQIVPINDSAAIRSLFSGGYGRLSARRSSIRSLTVGN